MHFVVKLLLFRGPEELAVAVFALEDLISESYATGHFGASLRSFLVRLVSEVPKVG